MAEKEREALECRSAPDWHPKAEGTRSLPAMPKLHKCPRPTRTSTEFYLKNVIFKCWYVLVFVCSRRESGVPHLIRLSGILSYQSDPILHTASFLIVLLVGGELLGSALPLKAVKLVFAVVVVI